MTEYFVKVEGLPSSKGKYLTVFGILDFDGKNFLTKLGNKKVSIQVDWYIEPVDGTVLGIIPTLTL